MSIIEKALDKLDSALASAVSTSGDKPGSEHSTDIPLFQEECEMTADLAGGIENRSRKSSNTITIDLKKLDALGYITPETSNLHLFEQYRHIKMQVLSEDERFEVVNNSNIIVITSSVPGEGKTYSSINLALSIAYEYNNRVLFIDGDVYKKTSSTIFDISNRPGLLDYLTSEKSDLADLLLNTNIEKFTVLPSGRFHERATELYNSKRMQVLMEELSKRYRDRLIIIDTPPLLQDTSTAAIARSAGKIIMVVEAEKTPRYFVEEALRRVNREKLLGIILNKSNQRYGSEYGYYSSYGKNKTAAS
ncbi:MAG: polysaccharide biosynthesis tyrosine autokinase [Gammaproteobacteria bacterium]|nr:MAG: polysaccharide biosynthesis tyrosine autokinase [Gammaproteobacteria bacterium]